MLYKMEWREIVLEINSMSPQKLNYVVERYSSWLDKMVRGCRGYARIIPFTERVAKLEVLIEKTKDPDLSAWGETTYPVGK